MVDRTLHDPGSAFPTALLISPAQDSGNTVLLWFFKHPILFPNTVLKMKLVPYLECLSSFAYQVKLYHFLIIKHGMLRITCVLATRWVNHLNEEGESAR